MKLFTLTLRKYIIDNRRALLLRLAGLGVLAVFIGFIQGFTVTTNPKSAFVFDVFVLSIFACIATSSLFSSMKTLRGRVATLTIPTTAFDAFAARWIIAVPVTIVASTAAFWLMELSRIFFLYIFNDIATAKMFTASDIGNEPRFICFARFSTIAVPMAFQAFFLFGSIAWPRHSAVKSVLILWVISFIGGLALYFAELLYNDVVAHNISKTAVLTSYITAVSLFILAFWYITYLRFKESDAADRLI